jgi:hypothetical protein
LQQPDRNTGAIRRARFFARALVVLGTIFLLATIYLYLELESAGCGKNLPPDLKQVYCAENPGALAVIPFAVAFYFFLLLAILTLPVGLLWLRHLKKRLLINTISETNRGTDQVG